jgi:predicted DNA-binding antitoxin AbrB/MazE fold protein
MEVRAMITVDAIFEGGVLRPKQPLDLPEGAEVRVVIRTETDDPLAPVIGICDEGPDISLAEQHDAILYGPLRVAGERP